MKEKVWKILKEAIAVNNRPFPWERAIGTGLAMAIPIFIGMWFNQLQYGLITGLGGFTYLYAFTLPYAHLSISALSSYSCDSDGFDLRHYAHYL